MMKAAPWDPIADHAWFTIVSPPIVLEWWDVQGLYGVQRIADLQIFRFSIYYA